MDDSLCLRPITELAPMLAAGELSSRELLAAYLARVERLDPTVNAVCTLAVERAEREPRAADERQARDDPLGPLHGLPMTIKDAIATAGIRSTGGVEVHRELCPFERCTGGRRAARRWGGGLRQDQPARLVGRHPELQRPCSGRRTIRGIRRGSRVVRRAVPEPPLPVRSRASSWAPTSAARSASRLRSAGSSGTSRASGSSRNTAISTRRSGRRSPTPTSTSSARSPARRPTSTSSSACSSDPPQTGRSAGRPGALGRPVRRRTRAGRGRRVGGSSCRRRRAVIRSSGCVSLLGSMIRRCPSIRSWSPSTNGRPTRWSRPERSSTGPPDRHSISTRPGDSARS